MMNKSKIIVEIITVGMVVIFGCKCNNGKENKAVSDSTNPSETVDSFSMESLHQSDSVAVFKNDTVTNALRKLSIDKNAWNSSHLQDIDTLPESTQQGKIQVDAAFLKKYASVIRMAPDHQYFLDLGSDNMIEQGGTLHEGDPETTISVVNSTSGEKITLRELGASGEVLKVHWLNNDKIAIVSTLPGKNPKKDDTYLNIYDVTTRVMKTYKW